MAVGPVSIDISQYQVALVGADESRLHAIERMLGDDLSTYTARSADEALVLVEHYPLALVLVDHPLPDRSALDFLRQVRAAGPRTLQVILADGDFTALEGESGAGDVFAILPRDAPFWQVRASVRRGVEARALADTNVRLASQFESLFKGSLSAISEALDAKDAYTYGHSYRVTQYALAIARQMNLPPVRLNDLEIAGLLHDIGKIGIPESILGKPGRLTEEEFQMVKTHPVRGYRMLLMLPGLENALRVVRHHHERHDGTGYPDGLSGEQIPALARILAVADSYDAMTSNRPYRPAMSHADAVVEVKCNAGKQFDPQVVKAFLGLREMAEVRQVIEQAPDLPAFSPTVAAGQHLLAQEEPDMADLSRLIASDQAMAAKVLRLVNSAHFSLPRKISDIHQAVTFVGLRELQRILVLVAAQPLLSARKGLWLWNHSISTAVCCEVLARKTGEADPGEAFTAGLLHDAGTALLQRYFPGSFERVLQLQEAGTEVLPAELMVFGVDHAIVGAWLMETWGLEASLCDAVRYHHDPFHTSKPLGHLVALGNGLAHCLDPKADRSRLDGALMDRFRLAPGDLDPLLEDVRRQVNDLAAMIQLEA